MNDSLSLDLIGMLVSTCLTLCVFSYLIKGDFFLYRVAVAILTGGGAAYVLVITLFNVILPHIYSIPHQTDRGATIAAGMGLFLGLLVVFKGFQRSAIYVWIGQLPIAYLLGVGVGLATGGALVGTLLTQGLATATSQGGAIPGNGPVVAGLNLITPLVMLVTTLSVFISFTFLTSMRHGLGGIYTRAVRGISTFGRAMLALSFGAIFAGVYIASVSVLISRIHFLVEVGQKLIETIQQLAVH